MNKKRRGAKDLVLCQLKKLEKLMVTRCKNMVATKKLRGIYSVTEH